MEIKRDNKGRFVKTTTIPNKRKLYNLYWKKEFSLSKLAEVFGVCLEQIRKWMIKYQIPRRPQYFHKDSEETRIKKSNSKIGEKNSFYRKKHTKETIEKLKGPKSKTHIQNLCKAQKKYFKEHPEASERLRKINLGRKCSEKTREKRRELSKGEKNPMYGKHHTKETIQKLKNARAKQILPKKDTSIEVKIQNFLKTLGIEFFTHQYMKKIEHAYQCDILIPYMNLVIECDGDYWHKYPIGNDIDHIRTKELLEKGFKVMRLWEFEINEMSIKEFKIRLENLLKTE